MQNYIYIETYGCSANKNNSEILAGLLKQAGYEITNNLEIAEILIINTCIVKTKTESKIKRRIQDLSRLYPKKIMIIAGCMSETDRHSLKTINHKLLLLGIHHIKDIIKLLKNFKRDKLDKDKERFYFSIKNEEKLCLPKVSSNKLISIIQISEGCFGECSFCKTRLAKGKLFSYDMENIIKSVQNDLNSSAKEVWITSQDNASYGLDKGKQKLPELLRKILLSKHNFRLRLGMMNPNHLHSILDQMIEIYKNKKIYKFLHIPIQSASNKILKDMNRKYEIKIAKEIINKFKKEFPDIAIATDIIVGYPNETDEDHQKNIEFIKEFKPDVLNLSKFSRHRGTEANKLNPMPANIVNKRASELMDLHRKSAMENKQKYINREIKVFLNSKTKIPDVYEARDKNYNIILINSKNKSTLGKNINVKIKEIGVHHMRADLI